MSLTESSQFLPEKIVAFFKNCVYNMIYVGKKGAFLLIVLKESNNVKTDEMTVENPENKDRWRICIQQEDEREKMKNEPKVFSNLVIEKASELTFDATKGNNR